MTEPQFLALFLMLGAIWAYTVELTFTFRHNTCRKEWPTLVAATAALTCAVWSVI